MSAHRAATPSRTPHRRAILVGLGRALVLTLAFATLVAAATCAHTPECQRRIDACLRRCPPAEPRAEVPGDATFGKQPVPQPSDCERRCQGTCGPSPEGKEGPIEPAAGPLSAPGG